MTEDMVDQIHDLKASTLPEKTKVALEFAESWLLERATTIDDAFIARMKEHWTEPQIVEIAIGLGSWESYHKFNNAFDVDPPVDGIFETGRPTVPKEMKQHLAGLGVRPD